MIYIDEIIDITDKIGGGVFDREMVSLLTSARRYRVAREDAARRERDLL